MNFLIQSLSQEEFGKIVQSTQNAITTLSTITVEDIRENNANRTIAKFCSKFLYFEKNHGYYNFIVNNKIAKIRGANHENGSDENWLKFERNGLPNQRLSLSFDNRDEIPSEHNDDFGIPIVEHHIHYRHLYIDADLRLICSSIINYLTTGTYSPPTFATPQVTQYHQAKTNLKKKQQKKQKLTKQANKRKLEKKQQRKGVKRTKKEHRQLRLGQLISETINNYLRNNLLIV